MTVPTSSSSAQDDDFGAVRYSDSGYPAGPSQSAIGNFYDRYDQPTDSWGDTRLGGNYNGGRGSGPSSSPHPSAGERAPYDFTDTTIEPRAARTRRRARAERGLPALLALLVFLVICGIGGLIDIASGSDIKGGFNVALVVGALIGVIVVRRSAMFPLVVAPPIVYFLASAILLYFRSNGLKNRSVLLDAGVNWLVYGFPAIAGATAAVLIVAGIRMILRK